MSDIFDVVDEHDQVVRQEARAEVHRQRLRHRAVHVLVFNAGGAVYLQRRSAQKDTYPLRWTTSCSGHVDAGEDYDTAVVRELGEELGIAGTEVLRHQGTEHNMPTVGSSEASSGLAGIQPSNIIKIEADQGSPALPSSFILHPLIKHPPCRETGWEFIWIYTLTTEAAPTPDPVEIAEGRWCGADELDAWMAREPKAFTPSFLLVWKLWREKNGQN
ncbi:MAG TPA: NUDIX domain-containing protein [Opitutales bacterium]|nr:NUDIX domain-containing protein [Opitutales bacterium]